MAGETSGWMPAELEPRLERALRELERLDSEWVMHDVPHTHTYGRVPGEDEIRLWSIPRSSGELLRFLVIKTGAKSILELGTGGGYSTLWLGSGARETRGHVMTVDLFPPKVEIAQRYFREAGMDDLIVQRTEDAMDVTANWDPERPIDFLFLDADKENYSLYLENLLPHLRPGSLIVADNAANYAHLMESYFRCLQNIPRIQSCLVDIDHGLLLTTVLAPHDD